MWIRRTPEDIEQRRKRENSPRQYLIAFAVTFPLIGGLIFLKCHRQIGDHPDSSTIWRVLASAFALCLFGLAGAVIKQKFGLRTELFHGSGIIAGGRNMLCTSCWAFEDFRANRTCERCGGPCEDSSHWKWIDEEPVPNDTQSVTTHSS